MKGKVSIILPATGTKERVRGPSQSVVIPRGKENQGRQLLILSLDVIIMCNAKVLNICQTESPAWGLCKCWL